MHIFLYEVRNKLDGKIYIGVHQTDDLEDGYLGSGKVIRRAVLKHGVANFERRILETFDRYEDALEREKEVVNLEFIARSDVYNLIPGGRGGFHHINDSSLVHRERCRHAGKKGWVAIQEAVKSDPLLLSRWGKAGMSARKARGTLTLPPPFRGTHSQSTKDKMSAAKKGKHQGFTNSQFGTFWITDGSTNRKSKGEIPEGWCRGRVQNHTRP